jgi:hypothetical protein
MARYEIVPRRSRGFKINLKEWCGRPTYRNKHICKEDLCYRANGKQGLSQRSAYSMIEDLTDKGHRIIELYSCGRHANTYKVDGPMEALLKICDLAIKYKATRYRHDKQKPNSQYEVLVR